jgi:hypothetical protein
MRARSEKCLEETFRVGRSRLFDHLVGVCEQHRRHLKPERANDAIPVGS